MGAVSLLCPPLRGERGTAPSVRTTQPTSREHLRDQDEFFPRLPPRGAASHFRRVNSRPIREIDDASHARGEPIDQGLGIGELPADGFWQIGEHRLGGLRTAASIRADRAVRYPVCSSRRHRDPRRDRPRPPPVRRCWRERCDSSRTGRHRWARNGARCWKARETAGYRGRTDRRPRATSARRRCLSTTLVAFDRDRR